MCFFENYTRSTTKKNKTEDFYSFSIHFTLLLHLDNMPKAKAKTFKSKAWSFTLKPSEEDFKRLRKLPETIAKWWIFWHESDRRTSTSFFKGRFVATENMSLKEIKSRMDVFKKASLSPLDDDEDIYYYKDLFYSYDITNNNIYMVWSNMPRRKPSDDVIEHWKTDSPTQLQQSFVDVLRNQEDEKISFVYDPEGYSGKTTFTRQLQLENKAICIPSTMALDDSDRIIPWVMDEWNEVAVNDAVGEKVVLLKFTGTASKLLPGAWSSILFNLRPIKRGRMWAFPYEDMKVKPPKIMILAEEFPVPSGFPLPGINVEYWIVKNKSQDRKDVHGKYLEKISIDELVEQYGSKDDE